MKSSNNTQPFRDVYNRRIDYLRISITDKCNLKCVYCGPHKDLKYFKEDDVLTDKEIVRFVRIAYRHGINKVRITGGEPLLRKNIISLISSIKNVGISDLSLTTNGLMLSKLAGELKMAGLDRVNISLDTLNFHKYKKITNGGDINKVWEAIEKAESAGLNPVKINVVPIRGLNDDEIISFASLSLDKNYHIRFIELMPTISSGIWWKDKCINGSEVMEKLLRISTVEPIDFKGNGPSRNYRISGAKGIVGIISPISDHFCQFCNRIRLTADGKLRPCLFSKINIDIKGPMRKGVSDKEIENLFCRAIKVKPFGHPLNKNINPSKYITTMSKIGG